MKRITISHQQAANFAGALLIAADLLSIWDNGELILPTLVRSRVTATGWRFIFA